MNENEIANITKAAENEFLLASQYENCKLAHQAQADHFESLIAKASDADKPGLQTSLAFNKTMVTNYEKLSNTHKVRGEQLKASIVAPTPAPKPVTTTKPTTEATVSTEVNKAVTEPSAKVSPDNTAVAITAPVPGTAIGDTIEKALDSKLTEAIGTALDRVLASDEFNKTIDKKLSEKMLEKLGASTPTAVQTFPVPRPTTAQVVTPTVIKTEGIDPEFAHFASIDN